jgi:hypothetical protein
MNVICRFVTIYINIIITILDIICRPVFHLKYEFSDNGFCLRLQMEPTQVVPIDRAKDRD